MNEIFLVIAAATLLIVLPKVVKKSNYKLGLMIAATLVMLLLLWVFGPEVKTGFKVILSALVLSSTVRQIILYQKEQGSKMR